jgi:hypothetical protein
VHLPDRDELRSQYQLCIELLFPQVSEALQERLYKHLSLRDVMMFWSPDDASGYNRWEAMIHTRRISDAWKRRLDGDMRAIVMREVDGTAVPRATHEDAFRWYIHILSSVTFGNQLPYSTELYADQVTFALSVAAKRNASVFEGSYLRKALRRHLAADAYADLRQRLIANTWMHSRGLSLLEEELPEARKQAEEVRTAYPEIVIVIQRAIAQSEQALEERRAAEKTSGRKLHVVKRASLH